MDYSRKVLPLNNRLFGALVVVVFLLLRISLEPVSAAEVLCPSEVNEAIQQCVVPVAQYAEALGMGVKSTPEQLLPQMSSNVFQELCKLINAFEQCVNVSWIFSKAKKTLQESKQTCPQHITLSLIDASYGYLCNAGYKTFMDNADCLMRLDQEVTVRKCHDTTMNAIKDANNQHEADIEKKMKDMCKSLNYFTRCVESPVLLECGRNAWTVIVRVLRDTTQTLMPACILTPDVFTETDSNSKLDPYDKNTNNNNNALGAFNSDLNSENSARSATNSQRDQKTIGIKQADHRSYVRSSAYSAFARCNLTLWLNMSISFHILCWLTTFCFVLLL